MKNGGIVSRLRKENSKVSESKAEQKAAWTLSPSRTDGIAGSRLTLAITCARLCARQVHGPVRPPPPLGPTSNSFPMRTVAP